MSHGMMPRPTANGQASACQPKLNGKKLQAGMTGQKQSARTPGARRWIVLMRIIMARTAEMTFASVRQRPLAAMKAEKAHMAYMIYRAIVGNGSVVCICFILIFQISGGKICV